MKILILTAALFFAASARAAQISSAPYVQPPATGLCIFGAQSGKPFDTVAAFRSAVWKNDIIYAAGPGGDHMVLLARLEILKTMLQARGSKIAVGFEAFSVTLQPVLDDYVAGKAGEEEFLRRTGFEKGRDSDFGYYRPLFDFIRANRLRALAIGLPDGMLSKIARAGLAGLDRQENTLLTEPLKPAVHKKYTEYLKNSFDSRSADYEGADGQEAAFGNYLAAISASNEAMGKRLADFITENPSYAALVITGRLHVLYNAGMPAAVKARLGKPRQASFSIESAGLCPAKLPAAARDTANYVWYLPAAEKNEPGADKGAP